MVCILFWVYSILQCYHKQPLLSRFASAGIWRASECNRIQPWADSSCGQRLQPRCRPPAPDWAAAEGRWRTPGALPICSPVCWNNTVTWRCRNLNASRTPLEARSRYETLPSGSDLFAPLQSHCPRLLRHFSRKEAQRTFWATAHLMGWNSVPPGPPDKQRNHISCTLKPSHWTVNEQF